MPWAVTTRGWEGEKKTWWMHGAEEAEGDEGPAKFKVEDKEWAEQGCEKHSMFMISDSKWGAR